MIPIRDVTTAYLIGRRTVERWVKAGRLPTYRFPLDRITYVSREELEREMRKEPARVGKLGRWRQP